MKFSHQFTSDSRREFLTTSASGIGGIALQHMLSQNLEADTSIQQINDNRPHFAPKAKNCIFIFMAGAPSQLDLFDYKPKLNELNGQKMNADLLKGKRFAFLQKESAVLMGSPRKFKQHGKSGMWFSDLLPKTALMTSAWFAPCILISSIIIRANYKCNAVKRGSASLQLDHG